MTETEKYVRERLFALQDLGYRDFHAKLVPNLDKEKIIGVRAPALKKFEKEFSKDKRVEEFIRILPHEYYEENNLHAAIIGQIKDFDACLSETERFLPYVDNWATCDCFSPKAFAKEKQRLLSETDRWLASGKTYIVRFGIEMLMNHFLDEDFLPEYAEKVAAVKSREYYVNMMQAWYFATALAKQYNAVLPFIEGRALAPWTHNKSIQKAIESYRISPEQKEYLKTLKIKLNRQEETAWKE